MATVWKRKMKQEQKTNYDGDQVNLEPVKCCRAGIAQLEFANLKAARDMSRKKSIRSVNPTKEKKVLGTEKPLSTSWSWNLELLLLPRVQLKE